jgi:hypothetical protein
MIKRLLAELCQHSVLLIWIALVSFVLIAVGNRTFSRSNEEAISAMSEAEKAHLQTLSKIRRGMSYEQIVELLGPPDRSGLGRRPTWRFQGSPINQVSVYFDEQGARRVRWMSLGFFVYRALL